MCNLPHTFFNQTRCASFCTFLMFQACAEACACDCMLHICSSLMQCIKLEESRSYFPIHSWPFFLFQQRKKILCSFFKEVCFFLKKKCLRVAGFLQLGALNANIRHDPRREYNQWRIECSEHEQSWEVWGCSETPVRVLRGRAPRLA